MTTLKLLQEIEAWLCFNTAPSREEIQKLKLEIRKHVEGEITNIKIWDSQSKQWLEPIAIYFADNMIWKVIAKVPGEDPSRDGWYNLRDNLGEIAIVGEINVNPELLPKED